MYFLELRHNFLDLLEVDKFKVMVFSGDPLLLLQIFQEKFSKSFHDFFISFIVIHDVQLDILLFVGKILMRLICLIVIFLLSFFDVVLDDVLFLVVHFASLFGIKIW